VRRGAGWLIRHNVMPSTPGGGEFRLAWSASVAVPVAVADRCRRL